MKNFPSTDAHPGVAPSTALRLDPGVDSPWSNGRLLTDDGTDLTLSLIATKLSPMVADNVSANDKPFLSSIPWAALPWRPTEG